MDPCEYHIDGHTVISKHRNRNGGGVAVYLRNTIDFIHRRALQDNYLEFLFVEIRKTKTTPFLISTWYRPPGSTFDLFANFETILEKIEAENRQTFCNW